ncbi:MAG TPA: tetratricopeptide repeat protein [Steroidobacteraceae bacterium]|nr:tetratricopeptide repeat protein [Steroidobacteraceae bacterium]
MFSISHVSAALVSLCVIACAGCAGSRPAPDPIAAPQVFYTVTGEIALNRKEPRVAALQYAAAATSGSDVSLLARASEVTAQSLQPSLTAAVAARWIQVAPTSLEAHRAAAQAALELDRIAEAAEQYRIVLSTSPRGTEVEFADLEVEFGQTDNIFGARQAADRLAEAFPKSQGAARLQGFAAMRADDPRAAVRSFAAALEMEAAPPAAKKDAGAAPKGAAPNATAPDAAAPNAAAPGTAPPAAAAPDAAADARHELIMAYWRARILSGEPSVPLAESLSMVERDPSPSNVLDHAMLLLAAQKNDAAVTELETLASQPETAAVALRLLGLVDFQEGRLDKATQHFTELLSTGKFVDDSFYYLGLIAERLGDVPRAMRFYGRVQSGDNAVAALLRASNLLESHGESPAAQELLDHLIEDEPARAPEVLAARAKIYSDSGNAQRAIEVLDRGRQEYPDSVDIRYAVASTYEDQGQVKLALRELKDVLKSRPDDPAAMNAYGYTLADHNEDLSRARTLIERAYAEAPRNAAILDSLGWVLYRQGHIEEALPRLKTAYADDRGADIAAHLGEVLWQLDRRDEAEKVWAEAAKNDSDNKLLNATRLRLHASATTTPTPTTK